MSQATQTTGAGASITAVPATILTPLADGQERIAVLPATYGVDDLADVLKRFDEQVKFPRRNLKVVSEARVACIHQCTETKEITDLESTRSLEHALVLGHDMTTEWLVSHLRGRRVPQGRDAQASREGLARAPPFGVRTPGKRSPLSGVDDEDPEPGRQRDRSQLERPAIDQLRAIFTPGDRDELIHDSAGNASGPLLCVATCRCEHDGGRRPLGDTGECDGAGDLQGSARREAGADGNIGGKHSDHSDGRTSESGELAYHRGDVATPRGTHPSDIGAPVRRQLDRL